MSICPGCGAELNKTNFGGAMIDACPNCAGLWFDDGELSLILQGEPEAMMQMDAHFQPGAATIDGERALKCPRCETKLAPYPFAGQSDISLDRCESCNGVWIDNGELNKMAGYLREAKSDNSPIGPAPKEIDETGPIARAVNGLIDFLRFRK